MKKKYLLSLLSLVLFVPRVYAFTYEVNTETVKTSVEVGTETEIRVSLDNIKETDYGIASCSLDIEFSSGILLNSKIRTLNSWTLTTGEFYLFDTGDPVKTNEEIFVIPIKVNDAGNVKLFNIKCSDGESIVKVNDKVISFDVNNIQDEDDNEDDILLDSNCDLLDIDFSEGIIEFDSDVVEYDLKVTNYDELEITPILSSDKARFSLFKGDDNVVVIAVNAQDGTEKKYTIYVKEVSSSEMNKENRNNSKYVPIFIGIICVLVLINIVRLIVSRCKKK